MKLNRKGFMMAEVVVVSAVVLITLGTLYVSYNKIYSLYKTRLSYNDVSVLYKLAYYRDILVRDNSTGISGLYTDNDEIINVLDEISSEYISCNNCKDRVVAFHNNKSKINKEDLNLLGSNFKKRVTFKEYIDYLSDLVDFTNADYVMLIEHCNDDPNNENCKYAYLELNE